MNNTDLFSDEKVKLRLIQLEYDYKDDFNVSTEQELEEVKKKFEVDVRRIFLEETQRELPKNIEIYSSNELIKQNKDLDTNITSSGYDGTAIYIEDKSNEINQLHIISQGSQEKEDWIYNGFGLFLGIDDSQYEAAKHFTIEAKEKTNDVKNLKTYAMGHSLANNNQIMLQLIDGEFDGVYGVNGAQVSIDHLLNTDEVLYRNMSLTFNKYDSLDSVPAEELKAEIIKYYENKGVTAQITQRISWDDPLYGVSGKGDFITFGEIQMTDTNLQVEGIRNIIDSIQDEDVRNVKHYLQKYTDAYQQGGLYGFVKASTGIDIDLIESVMNADGFLAKAGVIINNKDDLIAMVGKVSNNLPAFLNVFHQIMDGSDMFIDGLAKNGYLDKDSQAKVKTELQQVDQHVSNIEEQFNQLMQHLEDKEYKKAYDTIVVIWSEYQAIRDSLVVLQEELEGPLEAIAEGHSILPLLNALSALEGISYSNGDICYTGQSSSGEEIKWNISSAVRIYQQGMKIVEDIEESIRTYERIYKNEIEDDFQTKKQRLIYEIHHIEANPSDYLWDFQFLLPNLGNLGSKIERIDVQESFYTAPLPENSSIVMELRKQATEKRHFIEEIRDSIESLFEKEELISQLFDFKG
ncbi:DUF6792 domain-containing protein [Niallia taxi]|uniref:DUF6792 domain-containing protein n=1 Tax=Niallia taxi TaxID=2499688 RepID=A0A437K315_9BACI|nr:DUF6792 domain-containing protein [Niallia taxi]RVT56542.1 hypothetical protein EM808_27275 [Niallia taxi]